MEIELHALELFGRHGVEPEERERGQRFVFEVVVEVGDEAVSDRLEDAVDYRGIARAVREVSDGRQFALLEALAAAVADELLARFAPIRRARVQVRKPEVKLDPPVEYSAVTVERSRR
jgi:7,8-dihydroneopterin aldolase/epimerase/oxygenase